MSNQIAITRCPGIPVSVLSDTERAVLPIPDCPHHSCHHQCANILLMLDSIGATYKAEDYPLGYDEEAEEGSTQEREERRGAMVVLLLPVLAEIHRRGADLSQYEAMAQRAIDMQGSDPFTDGAAFIFAPYSVN